MPKSSITLKMEMWISASSLDLGLRSSNSKLMKSMILGLPFKKVFERVKGEITRKLYVCFCRNSSLLKLLYFSNNCTLCMK